MVTVDDLLEWNRPPELTEEMVREIRCDWENGKFGIIFDLEDEGDDTDTTQNREAEGID